MASEESKASELKNEPRGASAALTLLQAMMARREAAGKNVPVKKSVVKKPVAEKPSAEKTVVEKSSAEVITLTMGDCAENHKGMAILGHRLEEGQGFSLDDFTAYEAILSEKNIPFERVDLTQGNPELPPASVLLIRNGLAALAEQEDLPTSMYEEHKSLEWDKKCYMYGRVVNKNARWNLCYDEKASEPDYENKMGRVIALDDVPLLQGFMARLKGLFGHKMDDLKVEGNRYYDTKTCGIGWHGDTERVKVVAIRLGTPGVNTPILYQWYKDSETMGDQIEIPLYPGDIYLMSEKAVGQDWKRKKIPTLRHATGSSKYTGPSK